MTLNVSKKSTTMINNDISCTNISVTNLGFRINHTQQQGWRLIGFIRLSEPWRKPPANWPGEHPLSVHPVSHPGKHPHTAHFGLTRSKHPLSAHVAQPLYVAAVGFREPPNKLDWLRETPYMTIPVFPMVTVTVSTPTLRSLAPAVWDLSKQAHNPLYINHRSIAPPLVRLTDFLSFRITLHILSDQ